MNITELSADNWLHVRSINNEAKNGSNSTTSSNNDQSSPNPQVWDLRWFALLSGPLLFGTIILPLITGPAIRYVCQSYVTLRVYWRLGFVFLAVTYLTLFYNTVTLKMYIMLTGTCDIALLVFVWYQVFIAWRFKKLRWVWTCCLVLVLVVWLLDYGVSHTGKLIVPFGFCGWILILLVLLFTYRREAIAKGRADTRVS